MAGRLIVIEGIDGSGKSTQFGLLCDRLDADGIVYKRLVFPRYSEPSSMLIRMYLGGELGSDPRSVNAYAASSFFTADRYISFIQDWRRYYESGGLVVTDRYTTSNAIHQGAKMAPSERAAFFKWLYEYEFELIRLPKPDITFYLNISAETAAKRLSERQIKTETSADIHEQDTEYLTSCAQCGQEAASALGWHTIDCFTGGTQRPAGEIHSEIYRTVRGLADD